MGKFQLIGQPFYNAKFDEWYQNIGEKDNPNASMTITGKNGSDVVIKANLMIQMRNIQS